MSITITLNTEPHPGPAQHETIVAIVNGLTDLAIGAAIGPARVYALQGQALFSCDNGHCNFSISAPSQGGISKRKQNAIVKSHCSVMARF